MKAWRHRVGPRTIAGVIALSAIGTILSGVPAHATPASGTCFEISLAVALAAEQPRDQRIVGTLCNPNGANARREIDVLIHGGSYSRLYWDFPVDTPQYSYVERTLRKGRATLAVDLIGAGDSSKPLSANVTNVFAVHQVIQWLRSDRGYRSVNLIAHSLGSTVAIVEAATYKDVDRLVVTSLLHPFDTVGVAPAVGSLYPAELDSKFQGQGLDPGYVTTMPGARSIFYSPSAAPEVIAADEANKDVAAFRDILFSFEQILTPAPLNPSRRVTAPVFTMVGQQDTLFCGPSSGIDCGSASSVAAHERPYYPDAASVTAWVVPKTAHNIALHPSAQQSFDAINQWLQSEKSRPTNRADVTDWSSGAPHGLLPVLGD